MAVRRQDEDVFKLVRLPFLMNHVNRFASVSKDQIFYNVILETIKNEFTKSNTMYLVKRGAFVTNTTVIGGGGTGRGIYYWEKTGKTYSVIGNKLYSNTTELHTLTTSTGTCWFTEDTGPSNTLILGDGTDLFTISSSDVVTDITDVDLPTGPITPVTMNGYVFVAKSGTDEIYNSDVAAPTAWQATSFLSAEMYSDTIVALSRMGPYVVAFGQFSVEFFYDAGNATGSPLRRQDSVAMRTGCAARDSVVVEGKSLYFVARSQIGEPSVMKFEHMTPKVISTKFIDRILAAEGSSLSSAKAWICHHKGHTLYILNLSSQSRTLVYDDTQDMWFDWSHNSSSTHVVLPYNYGTQGANGITLALHNTNGIIYKLDPDTYQDTLGAILVKIVTSKYDFNSMNRKRIHKLTIIADTESSGTITLDWSDDDYATWAGNRSLDLTTIPYANNLGSFYRRAFRLQHSANAPLRIEALEVEMSEGEH